MTIDPKILQHPNIPKPMHGMAPRTVMGNAWWNKMRHEVYHDQGFCCAACGVHKTETWWIKKWLECHEDYEIDYVAKTMTIKRMVALCPPCHKFIHSGLLAVNYAKGDLKAETVKRILSHGFAILKDNMLAPSVATAFLVDNGDLPTVRECKMLMLTSHKTGIEYSPEWETLGEGDSDWGGWRMIFEGKEYPSLWPTKSDWFNHYGRQ